MEESSQAAATRRLWVIVFVLVSLVLIAGGLLLYRFERARVLQGKYQDLAAIAELKAGQISEWRHARLGDARRAASGPFIRKAVMDWLQDPGNADLRAELQAWLQLEQEGYDHGDVLLLDPDGRILLSLAPKPDPLSPTGKHALEAAIAGRKAALSDFYRCPQGKAHLDAVAPILDEEGRPLAAVIVRDNADDVLYPLLQSWPTPSRTAETLLISREGDSLLYLNELRHQPGTALSLRMPLTRTELPAVQAALGRQGMFEGKDYRGEAVLADLRPIPDTPWFMVSKVDTAEVLAEVHYRTGVALVFGLLVILLVATAVAYRYRQRQAGLYRDLYRAEQEQRQAEEEFRTTLYSIGDAVITTDALGRVKQMNAVAEQLTGWTERQARGRALEEVFSIINEKTRAAVENPVHRILREGTVVGLANHTLLIAKDGTERPIADSGAPICDENGDITGVVLIFRDQTAERAAQRALAESEARFSMVFRNSPIGIVLTHLADGRFVDANPAFLHMLGYTREEVMGRSTLELGHWVDPAERDTLVRQLSARGRVEAMEARLCRKSGEIIPVLVWGELVDLDGQQYLLTLHHDISERKKEEEARHRLEMQLHQAQKMEAIGRLAGGVAHDFNNMLTVILGCSGMLLSGLDPADPGYQDLQQIVTAAKRSTELTRQLLAFSRKQIIAPKVIDLDAQLRGMERLLQRIIGEDITLEVVLSPGLWPVRMDTSQVDQIVANLVVNARDAMPSGGKLTVQAGNVTLDEASCQTHPEMRPGDYVLLTVSDTGCGMDRATLERVFEPFFTTKAEGKGTGLGLSTVYGIVKQNDGFISIYSEMGQGTTVRIYLPRYQGAAAVEPAPPAEAVATGGHETILLVEDQDELRRMTHRMLEQLGYHVLEAAGPEEAIALCENHSGEIHLLLTDVVMPGVINGKTLSERIGVLKPGLRTLFMSGYTANVVAHGGVLDEGIHFLQKPFSLDCLGRSVRVVLDS